MLRIMMKKVKNKWNSYINQISQLVFFFFLLPHPVLFEELQGWSTLYWIQLYSKYCYSKILVSLTSSTKSYLSDIFAKKTTDVFLLHLPFLTLYTHGNEQKNGQRDLK